MLKLSVKTRQFLRRQKPPQFLWRLGGLGCIQVLNQWWSTLDYKCFLHEPSADPSASDFQPPAIFVFWHEYLPIPVYLRPNSRLAMLVSQHQDAEILSQMARFAGLETVRGSSSRGGTAALKEIMNRGDGRCLAITPDGPRGPRRKLAQGCIYLSSRLQIPVIPLGMGYDRPWRNHKSWDKFAFPRPYSRCRAVLGPRIQVPADLDREGIEHYRVWIESELNSLTEQAEQWAERKLNVSGARPLCRQSPQSRLPALVGAAPKKTDNNERNITNGEETVLKIAG